jgi:hypothetical protein
MHASVYLCMYVCIPEKGSGTLAGQNLVGQSRATGLESRCTQPGANRGLHHHFERIGGGGGEGGGEAGIFYFY